MSDHHHEGHFPEEAEQNEIGGPVLVALGLLGSIVLVIWAIQLIISPIWLKYFLFGPLEWLWRSLTYWKLQPMKR